jgi:hypothetical protein
MEEFETEKKAREIEAKKSKNAQCMLRVMMQIEQCSPSFSSRLEVSFILQC